jgi:hypothetical protein
MEHEPLFASSHDALLFAFHSGRQSPRSPLASLLPRGGIGSGKGLHGIEGAAQAGIILARYKRLEKPQQHVLRVRFGRNETECAHCGTVAPCTEWTEALDALSRCAELDGVHRAARHAMVAKAVCGQKLEAAAMTAIDNLLRDAGVVG